jgi:hypothetical protein
MNISEKNIVEALLKTGFVTIHDNDVRMNNAMDWFVEMGLVNSQETPCESITMYMATKRGIRV